jgi:hypothetical protein
LFACAGRRGAKRHHHLERPAAAFGEAVSLV